MPHIRSLPDGATFLDIIKSFPGVMFPWSDVEERLLRGAAPFTEAQRELLVAFVSGLNQCSYCYRSHTFVSAEFGLPEDLPSQLLEDVDSSPIDDTFKPVLRYVKKLNDTPDKMTPADADAIYEAGWGDDAIFFAAAICAYTNFVNRLVDGLGLEVDDDPLREIAKHLKNDGYAGVKEFLKSQGISG